MPREREPYYIELREGEVIDISDLDEYGENQWDVKLIAKTLHALPHSGANFDEDGIQENVFQLHLMHAPDRFVSHDGPNLHATCVSSPILDLYPDRREIAYKTGFGAGAVQLKGIIGVDINEGAKEVIFDSADPLFSGSLTVRHDGSADFQLRQLHMPQQPQTIIDVGK